MYGVLDTWNSTTNSNVCLGWEGVTCNTAQRVASLFLGSGVYNISGTLVSALGNLSSLTNLDLSYNSFHGEIPTILRFCSNLQTIGRSQQQPPSRQYTN